MGAGQRRAAQPTAPGDETPEVEEPEQDTAPPAKRSRVNRNTTSDIMQKLESLMEGEDPKVRHEKSYYGCAITIVLRE